MREETGEGIGKGNGWEKRKGSRKNSKSKRYIGKCHKIGISNGIQKRVKMGYGKSCCLLKINVYPGIVTSMFVKRVGR